MAINHFRYKDSKGNITLRKVDVRSRNHLYISGYCENEDKELVFRTFRYDRIVEFLSDSEYLEEVGLLPPLPTYEDITKSSRSQGLSVLFTGFKKDRRSELEASAEAAGLVVKKDSVSKRLDFICGGYNAGPSKLKKADEYGVTVLDEASYLQLLITGEIPIQV